MGLPIPTAKEAVQYPKPALAPHWPLNIIHFTIWLTWKKWPSAPWLFTHHIISSQPFQLQHNKGIHIFRALCLPLFLQENNHSTSSNQSLTLHHNRNLLTFLNMIQIYDHMLPNNYTLSTILLLFDYFGKIWPSLGTCKRAQQPLFEGPYFFFYEELTLAMN